MTPSFDSAHLDVDARNAAAGGLAILGALGGIPLGLAQLDFAGLIDVFSIDADGSAALHAIAGIAGCLTLLNVGVAFSGAVLAFVGARHARVVLIACALTGFATALMLWLPNAIALAGAAALLTRTTGHDVPQTS